eukprot:2427140-Amphidinium_carterae.1
MESMNLCGTLHPKSENLCIALMLDADSSDTPHEVTSAILSINEQRKRACNAKAAHPRGRESQRWSDIGQAFRGRLTGDIQEALQSQHISHVKLRCRIKLGTLRSAFYVIVTLSNVYQ